MNHYMVNTAARKNSRQLGGRQDPYLGCNFLVQLDGMTVGGFSDVSGLSVETGVETKNFGGENDKTYAFITQTKYSDITLKHGISDNGILWDWHADVVRGVIRRKNGTIYMLDEMGQITKIWWHFFNALPIKWEGPTFSATGSSVAFESIVLSHQGLYMHK